MATEPWSMTSISGGRYRITNNTGAQAGMVTVQTVRNESLGEIPAPIPPGGHFDVRIKPGVQAYVGWTTPARTHHTWRFSV